MKSKRLPLSNCLHDSQSSQGGESPFRAPSHNSPFAKIRASVLFPTPSGPQKMTGVLCCCSSKRRRKRRSVAWRFCQLRDMCHHASDNAVLISFENHDAGIRLPCLFGEAVKPVTKLLNDIDRFPFG